MKLQQVKEILAAEVLVGEDSLDLDIYNGMWCGFIERRTGFY